MHPPDISDHSLIVFNMPLVKPKPASHYATVRGWKKMDMEAFRRDLVSSDICSDAGGWSALSPDDMAEMYSNILTNLVDKHAPRREVRKHFRPITPWFNEACREQKRRARCFERIYRKDKTQINRTNWLASLRSAQDFYKQVQDVYWHTLISESSGNARKLWNTLSSVMGKKKGSIVQENFTPELFLNSFMDKVSGVRSSTVGSPAPEFSNFVGSPLNKFSTIDQSVIEDSIRKSSNKFCSLDPIPTWLVKELVCELTPFVTELFNKSISEGYFPKSFRIGEITPILKKASLDPSIITNYRPVSNLSFLSKLLERTINKQLLSHLNDNDLLPEYQSAYRSCHSTETALLKVTSDALTAADRGTILGFLDLSAAFDCVDHQILMTRLERTFGISCSALDWIKSYLEGRTQRVRYNGAISALAELSCGVPQGSVLGPLYFLLYTADVFQIAHQQGFKIHGYADDFQLYQHCLPTDVDMMKDCFSRCVERIMVWMSSNRLRLNASKTEILWLGSSRRLARTALPSSIVIDNCSVPLADEVKCLGVTIDSALTFSKHVSSLVRTCYFQLRQLRSITKSPTVDTCHALVRSLIISRLDYCNGILTGPPADLLNRLDGVLRGAARLILKRQRSDHISDSTREQLHWLDIRSRIEFKMSLLAFRCLYDSAPRYLAIECTAVAGVTGRSHLRSAASGDVLVPACQTLTIGPRASIGACPRAWNTLPRHLRRPGISLSVFKKEQNTELFRRMLDDKR